MLVAKLLVWLGLLLGAAVLCELVVLAVSLVRRLYVASGNTRLESALLSQRLELGKLQLKRQETLTGWNSTRKFKVDRIVRECEDVKSFYLVPHDGRALPGFVPGQYLTFELDIPGQRQRVIRCYSLAERPRPDYYRVMIKRVAASPDSPGAQPGLVSNFFHDQLKEGDILDLKAPCGSFCLDTSRSNPVVLLGGGVGLTPLLSMLNEVVAAMPGREVWLFYGVRNSSEHLVKEHLASLGLANGKVRVRIFYSRPLSTDVVERDYHFEGRLTVEALKKQLPSNNYEFYLCGPGQMMQDLHQGLLAWGVPQASIHLEAFGPASVRKTTPVPAPGGHSLKVSCSRSGQEFDWTGQADSLLDLALGQGVPMGYGCRAGNCGTCKTAIKSGKVKYLKEPGCEVELGSCLPCICVPDSALVLEA